MVFTALHSRQANTDDFSKLRAILWGEMGTEESRVQSSVSEDWCLGAYSELGTEQRGMPKAPTHECLCSWRKDEIFHLPLLCLLVSQLFQHRLCPCLLTVY